MSELSIPKVVSVYVTRLHPSKYNPRKISVSEFRKLKKSIRTYGFVKPIVVQKKKMNIIGGHQGLKAILEICKEDGLELPKVPCIILDIKDRQAKLLNLALNNIDGEFDEGKLSSLLREMNEEAEFTFDELESAGYEISEVEKMISDIDHMMDSDDDLHPFAASVTLSLKFDSVEERDTVKAILTERSSKDNMKPGTVLHRLLTRKPKRMA